MKLRSMMLSHAFQPGLLKMVAKLQRRIFGANAELAYLIRKQKQGQYVLLQTKMNPALGATLERNLGYLEPVMRYMLIARD